MQPPYFLRRAGSLPRKDVNSGRFKLYYIFGSNTFSHLLSQNSCYIIYATQCRRTFSRALKVSARNGWFTKTAQQHGQYLHTLFAIHQLFKVQVLHVFIQAKIRRLHESMRDYCRIQQPIYLDCTPLRWTFSCT